ncbi:hypothetical protein [Clostridium tertium]|uniref:Nudix hydrolase domain-containing protein n=1 Tax=Clostridium tertium TaxID=1559 RepID=A0A6N3BN27_9CLOT
MNKVAECSVIIKDDFNNIFLVMKKTKKNAPKYWYSVSRKIKGKESEEKCVTRAIKDDLKSIVFNLDRIGEITNSITNEKCAVFKGELKEKVILGKDLEEGKWVSISEVHNYDLAPDEKEKLKLFFDI